MYFRLSRRNQNNINYNGLTEKSYISIYYDYNSENCLIEGEQLDSY